MCVAAVIRADGWHAVTRRAAAAAASTECTVGDLPPAAWTRGTAPRWWDVGGADGDKITGAGKPQLKNDVVGQWLAAPFALAKSMGEP